MSSFKGGCMCGKYRYESSSQPAFSAACYCRECQFVSGGAPANVVVAQKVDVTVTPSMPRAWWTTSDKGNRVARYFCEECGTPIFAESASNPLFLAIKAGSLDDSSAFKPLCSIWVSSAKPWHRIDPDIPRFDKDPM